MRSVFVLITVK